MSRRWIAVVVFAASATALSGCIVVPAHPGYGYGARHIEGHGRWRAVPPPPVYVTPWPYYRDRHGRHWERR